MYHGNKSLLLKIFSPTPTLTSTLKKDALILDFLAIVNSQVAATTAKTFGEFADGIIRFVKHYLLNGFWNVVIKKVDSDVATLFSALYLFSIHHTK